MWTPYMFSLLPFGLSISIVTLWGTPRFDWRITRLLVVASDHSVCGGSLHVYVCMHFKN